MQTGIRTEQNIPKMSLTETICYKYSSQFLNRVAIQRALTKVKFKVRQHRSMGD